MHFSSTHTETPHSCSESVVLFLLPSCHQYWLSTHVPGTLLDAKNPLVPGSVVPAFHELSWTS